MLSDIKVNYTPVGIRQNRRVGRLMPTTRRSQQPAKRRTRQRQPYRGGESAYIRNRLCTALGRVRRRVDHLLEARIH